MRNNADQIYSTSRQTGEQCRSPIMETLMRLTEAPICHFICSLRIMGIVRARLSENHLRLVALAFHRSAMTVWKFSTICHRLCFSVIIIFYSCLYLVANRFIHFVFRIILLLYIFFEEFIVYKRF